MSALTKMLMMILNVADHPVWGPIARKVAYQATKEILRMVYRGRARKTTARVG